MQTILMQSLKTLKIKTDTNDLGYYFINEDDFDDEIMDLFEAEKPKVAKVNKSKLPLEDSQSTQEQ